MAIDMLINWFADEIFSLWNPHLCQWNPHFLGLIKTVLWSKHGYHVVWSSSVEILRKKSSFLWLDHHPPWHFFTHVLILKHLADYFFYQCEHSYHTAVGMISQQNRIISGTSRREVSQIPSGYVKIAIANSPFIVDLSIENGDFHSYVSLPEGNSARRIPSPFFYIPYRMLQIRVNLY